jgi:hypothetical protein
VAQLVSGGETVENSVWDQAAGFHPETPDEKLFISNSATNRYPVNLTRYPGRREFLCFGE